MEQIAGRIKELIQELELTNKDFAESINIAPAIISHVLSGRNNPSLHLIQQITNVYTNVNLSYLLNGSGELFAKDIRNVKHRPINTAPIEQATQSSQENDEKSNDSANADAQRSKEAPLSDSFKADEKNNALKEQDEGQRVIDKPNKGPEKEDLAELTNVYTNVNRKSTKRIERIVVFYTDRTFREYEPEA